MNQDSTENSNFLRLLNIITNPCTGSGSLRVAADKS